MPRIAFLSYSELRQREHVLELYKTEIPTEHDKSLPLPTLRWNTPAYACFASPALRRPGQPKEISAPDRWWLIDAQSGRLALYALWQTLPYAPNVEWNTMTLPLEKKTIAEIKALAGQVEQLFNVTAPAFFTGDLIALPTRMALFDALRSYIPAPIWSMYQALTPDFFAWLSARR